MYKINQLFCCNRSRAAGGRSLDGINLPSSMKNLDARDCDMNVGPWLGELR